MFRLEDNGAPEVTIRVPETIGTIIPDELTRSQDDPRPVKKLKKPWRDDQVS